MKNKLNYKKIFKALSIKGEYFDKNLYISLYKATHQNDKIVNIYLKDENYIYHLTSNINSLAKIRILIENIKTLGIKSPRPYRLKQACDSSVDACLFALLYDFCKKHNIDIKNLFQKVYGETLNDKLISEIIDFAIWQGVDIPKKWSKNDFQKLLQNLIENKKSLLAKEIEKTIKGKKIFKQDKIRET